MMTQACSKVALITGSAARVGAVIAQKLHQAGMNVIIHYRHSAQQAHQLMALLNQKKQNSARVIQFDLNDATSFQGILPEILSYWGRLDVLVHNASDFYRTDIGQVQLTQWDDLLGSNVKGPFFLTQALIPALKQTNGCVISIADIHGERPLKDYSVYCIAKSALIMMTKSLARELAPEIRVNAIAPGAVCWPVGDNELDPLTRDKILSQIPLKRPGNPEDVAKTVQFIIDTGYLTGEIIHLDGGRLIR